MTSARQPAATDPAPGPGDNAARLQAILETAVEGIITIDERGIIESVNPAAEKIFGYSAAEMTGRNVGMLMPAPDAERHDDYIRNYLRTGRAKIIGIGREVTGRRKDGTHFPMDLSVSEVRLAHGRMFTGFIRDITERKAAEARLAELARSLEEKNKELETIVYVASHDLRSPLVNIQGFSQELSRVCARLRQHLAQPAPSPEARAEVARLLAEDIPESIDFILAGARKIDSLLAGFLRFSRLGRAAIRIENLDMNALVADIVRAMEFQIQRAGARVTVENLPPCRADLTLTSQVFANVLDNAIKYLDPGRPGLIHVSGVVEADQAVFQVADNGIGIAPEHQPRVFEIFHRLNPSVAPGEGLGLTIAQRILERQGGRIWLTSEPGRGSTFFVSLPGLASTPKRVRS
ncbi:MAG TPA: PAS domain S-box protein [Methylomirabilota bacterium]|nr:PAS domain S-box protein [Methylomirabilota bacterium]